LTKIIMQPTPADFPLLSKIESPAQLRTLSEAELVLLATELRNFLIQSLNQSGGHFAGGLGTVELTVALHAVFNTPDDRLVWDVGHQTYPHKILTGRREQLSTIRQPDGLAGFPRRSESPYDTFGVGHSSTSISAALGMAQGSKRAGSDRKTVAIIGDGAMTAGMVFEALNHGGDMRANLLVVLNDNDMSISKNVGGLSNYLARILSSKLYTSMREGGKKVLDAMPNIREFARRTEEHMKGMVVPGTLFEELGFNYIGPIDGHDLPVLLKTLQNLKDLEGPQFLHIITRKGKGYAPAEADPIGYHAVSPGYLDSKNSEKKTCKPTYSDIFGNWICDIAAQDPRVVAITPAMCEGSGLVRYAQEYPDRYFDVGIAEQHSVTFAAGLACEGQKPVVAIYSTFLQRAYDQLIHDVAIQNLPVLFAIDRAGLVGADGPTHAGSFDLSYLRCIPNMLVMAPSDENECRQMLYTGFQHNGPAAVRYPRGTGPGVKIQSDMTALPIGKAEIRRQGKQIALLAFGSMLTPALQAAEALNATVINMRFIKPLDTHMLQLLASEHTLFVTIEENVVMGGAGSAVNEYLATQNIQISTLNLGLPDKFIEHGSHAAMLADCGLDAAGIIKSVQERISDRKMSESGFTGLKDFQDDNKEKEIA
jgi:1-deoxy-D-xylulose-5-phosphate synthase